MSLPSDVKKPSFRELTQKELTQVKGGAEAGTEIGVPTEGCPLCTSGIDPTTQNAQFQDTLLG
jgi:bacteriocin-like protein